MSTDNRNLTWHPHKVTKSDRWLRTSMIIACLEQHRIIVGE